jgi:hypothetical protein
MIRIDAIWLATEPIDPKNGSYPVAICRKEGRGRTI